MSSRPTAAMVSGVPPIGPAERVRRQDELGEPLVDDVRRVVVVHGELLEDDPALALDVPAVEPRGGDHVEQDVGGESDVLVEHPRVVAGVLLAGDRVGLAADGVEGRRRCPSRSAGRCP